MSLRVVLGQATQRATADCYLAREERRVSERYKNVYRRGYEHAMQEVSAELYQFLRDGGRLSAVEWGVFVIQLGAFAYTISDLRLLPHVREKGARDATEPASAAPVT